MSREASINKRKRYAFGLIRSRTAANSSAVSQVHEEQSFSRRSAEGRDDQKARHGTRQLAREAEAENMATAGPKRKRRGESKGEGRSRNRNPLEKREGRQRPRLWRPTYPTDDVLLCAILLFRLFVSLLGLFAICWSLPSPSCFSLTAFCRPPASSLTCDPLPLKLEAMIGSWF